MYRDAREAGRPAVPEFDPLRDDPEAAPMRGARDRAAGEPFFDRPGSLLQRVRRRHSRSGPTPMRRSGCRADASRNTRPTPPADSCNRPFHTNLLLERRPMKAQRCARVLLQVGRFPAVVVRVEHEPAIVHVADQHYPDGGAAGGVRRRQSDRRRIDSVLPRTFGGTQYTRRWVLSGIPLIFARTAEEARVPGQQWLLHFAGTGCCSSTHRCAGGFDD